MVPQGSIPRFPEAPDALIDPFRGPRHSNRSIPRFPEAPDALIDAVSILATSLKPQHQRGYRFIQGSKDPGIRTTGAIDSLRGAIDSFKDPRIQGSAPQGL